MENAAKLIPYIRPYLIGKSFQPDCILEYVEHRLTLSNRKKSNKKRKYTKRDFELVASVYEANGDIRGTSETIRQDALKAMI